MFGVSLTLYIVMAVVRIYTYVRSCAYPGIVVNVRYVCCMWIRVACAHDFPIREKRLVVFAKQTVTG